jgi:hypothetical protein
MQLIRVDDLTLTADNIKWSVFFWSDNYERRNLFLQAEEAINARGIVTPPEKAVP